MFMRNPKLLLILLALPLVSGFAAGQDRCSRLFSGNTPPSPEARDLTKADTRSTYDKRACIKSYGLPGGAENLPNLTSDEILRDQKHLADLFRYHDTLPDAQKKALREAAPLWASGGIAGRLRWMIHEDELLKTMPTLSGKRLTSEDLERLADIDNGWDQEQITLYGDALYLRKLLEEERFTKCATVGDRIIKDRHLSLSAAPVTAADTHTYFSNAFLTNMIVLETLQARSLGNVPVSNPGVELRQIVDFLDAYPDIRATYGGKSKDEESISLFDTTGGDPLELLTSRVSAIAQKHQGDMVDLSSDFGELAVISRSGDEVTVYLKGKNLHAIRGTADGDFEWLSASDAATGFRAFCKKEVSLRSTADMKLFNVMAYDDAVEVDFGSETYTVSSDDLTNMRAGVPLPGNHPLIRAFAGQPEGSLVLYSNPLTVSHGKLQDGADDFAFLLQATIQDRTVYRDPLSAHTAERVKGLNGFQLASAKDLIAVVADSSFSVTDYKIIQNLKTTLRNAGVDVRTFSPGAKIWHGETGRAVIVITGHIDQKLAAFVRELGQQGVFKGNYVVFNSCRSPLTRDLLSEVNVSFGAEATFGYDAKIDAANVSNFVRDLTQTVAAKPGAKLSDTINETVHRAKLNGIWTICLMQPPNDSPDQSFYEHAQYASVG
jgi:hypothetical protein